MLTGIIVADERATELTSKPKKVATGAKAKGLKKCRRKLTRRCQRNASDDDSWASGSSC